MPVRGGSDAGAWWQVTDPVCGTLAMFLSTPVVFCCSNVGLLPFKNASMAVYPYGQMTAEQRALLM
eukprot:3261667-Rhodomonas_salina.1